MRAWLLISPVIFTFAAVITYEVLARRDRARLLENGRCPCGKPAAPPAYDGFCFNCWAELHALLTEGIL